MIKGVLIVLFVLCVVSAIVMHGIESRQLRMYSMECGRSSILWQCALYSA